MSSTTQTIRTLRCDHESRCTAMFTAAPDLTNVPARKQAKRQAGWSYIPGHPTTGGVGRDLCALHSATRLASPLPGGEEK